MFLHLGRSTCENVVRVLRANKDSVMAMLEAFVHDPLINWRLLNTGDTAAEPIAEDFSHLDVTGARLGSFVLLYVSAIPSQ